MAKWTPERRAELARLWAEVPHVSNAEIADRLGTSPGRVSAMAMAMVLPKRSDVCRGLRVASGPRRRRRGQPCLKIAPEVARFLLDNYPRLGLAAVAKRAGVDTSVAVRFFDLIDVPRKPGPRRAIIQNAA